MSFIQKTSACIPGIPGEGVQFASSSPPEHSLTPLHTQLLYMHGPSSHSNSAQVAEEILRHFNFHFPSFHWSRLRWIHQLDIAIGSIKGLDSMGDVKETQAS